MALIEANVRVAVRCRPLIGIGENLEGPAEFIKCLKEQKQVVVDDKVFSFDYVFDSTDKQKKIYETSATPIVDNFLRGDNAAIIAYGQTGSGKTFTMGTTEDSSIISEADSAAVEDAQDIGIIPRVLKHIFEHMTNMRLDDIDEKCNGLAEVTPIITVSFLEVYNEEVYDILNPSRPKVPIRESAHVIKLPDIKEVLVTSYEEAMECLSNGAQIRTTGATATNAHSSRSHAIFSVQLDHVLGNKHVQNRIMLVDLAGSEAVKKTKTQGPTFKEGININRGLLALGNVIRALSKEKGRCYVPYRDSTLSRLLQTCLQGNSNTLIIACINQVENNFMETTSTLQFAINARAIKIKLIAGDRETGTPCGWKRPYNSFVTPTTVGRSRLLKLHNVSSSKTPMNSTMLSAIDINENRNVAKMELNFSPLPTLEEALVEPVFKKPRTPPQIVSRPTAGFTPYVERICLSFEKCVGKLLANRSPASSSQFNASQFHVDSMARQTLHILQDCTNSVTADSNQSIFGSQNETVINTSPDLSNQNRKRGTSMNLRHSAEKSKTSTTFSRSMRNQTKNLENCPLKNQSSLHQSVIMSPRRTIESHTAQILDVLNNANVKQLQLLPHVGPKSAMIISNWRTQNGLFEDVLDMKKISGLPRSFMRNFAMKNSLIDHLED